MKKYRIYAAATVFIALSAVKLLAPDFGQELRLQVREFLDGEGSYTEFVETLGGRLSIEQAPAAPTEGETHSEAMELWLRALQPPENPEAQEESQANKPGELPDIVSAFIAEQLDFPGQELPKNIRIDMPELPFDYICPVEGIDSSGFGFREHPIEKCVKFHYGTDFAANGGTPVAAFAEGRVSTVGSDEGYGNYIILEHEGGARTLYAHLSRCSVSQGEQVSRGQTIGLVGATGKVTGPHLHFELMLDELYLNPEYYL